MLDLRKSWKNLRKLQQTIINSTTKDTYKNLLIKSFSKIKDSEKITTIDLIEDLEEYIYFYKEELSPEQLSQLWLVILFLDSKHFQNLW
jgi:hypothetical protein